MNTAEDRQTNSTANTGMPLVLRAREPDREVRAFLRSLNLLTRARSTDNHSLSRLPRLRQVWRLAALALGRRPQLESVIEREIDGPAGPITLRIFTPASSEQALPAFLWYHGGGFIIGGLDTGDSICRSIALAAGCITVAVRYRLAPEHDLSAGREDCLATLEWLARNGAELGIDTSRLAIGGDSAGGNIAAVVAQENFRRGGPQLCMQVLAYPATDLVHEFPSLAENAEGYLITARLLEQMKQIVAGSLGTLDAEDPWLSPRRSADLHGLPAAVVISAGFDPIRDDGLDYAARLRAAGVPVEVLHYAGQIHGFLNLDEVFGSGRDALQRVADALARVFRLEPIHNRTIEIADEVPQVQSSLLAAANEVATSTLTAWVATELWGNTLLSLLSPKAATVCQFLLKPWSIPVALVRGRIIARLDRLDAHQTYPTMKDCSAER
ncbi:alpha/beta hydrolase [Pseudomonas jinjuensis]|uniref:Acetyl esterase n=1 Tax=Pseudomonas jinjuensis TaxID=198616 RepID=A0A1H0JPE1_9PSED|nr:alpha/beta hydrolase [Pseudomonas jinjuensis]SDO45231.1 acetyl esterase [Pseudomonas jinjuensis]